MSYDDDQQDIADMAMEIVRLKKLLELPLLFHAGGVVRPIQHKRWLAITGNKDMTTKVMCDAIRKGLDDSCIEGG